MDFTEYDAYGFQNDSLDLIKMAIDFQLKKWMLALLGVSLVLSITGLVMAAVAYQQNRTVTTITGVSVTPNIENLVVTQDFWVTDNALVLQDSTINGNLSVAGQTTTQTLIVTDELTIDGNSMKETDYLNVLTNFPYIRVGIGAGRPIPFQLTGTGGIFNAFKGFAITPVSQEAGQQTLFTTISNETTQQAAFLNLTSGSWQLTMEVDFVFPSGLTNFTCAVYLCAYDQTLDTPSSASGPTIILQQVVSKDPTRIQYRTGTSVILPTSANLVFNSELIGTFIEFKHDNITTPGGITANLTHYALSAMKL